MRNDYWQITGLRAVGVQGKSNPGSHGSWWGWLFLCSVLVEEVDDGGVAFVGSQSQSSSTPTALYIHFFPLAEKHFYDKCFLPSSWLRNNDYQDN